MPEKFKGKKTENAGAVVEEEHLLSMVDTCNDISIFCVDIGAAYVLALITSIENGFRNVTDEDDIPGIEAPTECEDEEKVSELKTSCASEA
jgi:hypothetical protein